MKTCSSPTVTSVIVDVAGAHSQMWLASRVVETWGRKSSRGSQLSSFFFFFPFPFPSGFPAPRFLQGQHNDAMWLEHPPIHSLHRKSFSILKKHIDLIDWPAYVTTHSIRYLTIELTLEYHFMPVNFRCSRLAWSKLCQPRHSIVRRPPIADSAAHQRGRRRLVGSRPATNGR